MEGGTALSSADATAVDEMRMLLDGGAMALSRVATSGDEYAQALTLAQLCDLLAGSESPQPEDIDVALDMARHLCRLLPAGPRPRPDTALLTDLPEMGDLGLAPMLTTSLQLVTRRLLDAATGRTDAGALGAAARDAVYVLGALSFMTTLLDSALRVVGRSR